jgi:hypothetical protein
LQNPEASFDVLYIVHLLDSALAGVSQLQIQKLSFLGCILSMYRGAPSAEWGYSFATTEFGRPICPEITDSLQFFTSSGLISESDGRYSESPRGKSFLEMLLQQATFRKRAEYIKAACDSALSVPAGTLNQGIDNEPTLANTQIRARGDSLLTGPAMHLLHEHFSGLKEILANSGSDLLVPSIVWLSYTADSKISMREVAG